ncbi:MAG: hypothetical protein ABW252_10170 [Polyangiales bacterium]
MKLALFVVAIGVSAGCAREMLPQRGTGDRAADGETPDESDSEDEGDDEEQDPVVTKRPDAGAGDARVAAGSDAGARDAAPTNEANADAGAREPAPTSARDAGVQPSTQPVAPTPAAQPTAPATDRDDDSDDVADAGTPSTNDDGAPSAGSSGFPSAPGIGSRRGTSDGGLPPSPFEGWRETIREEIERLRNQSR